MRPDVETRSSMVFCGHVLPVRTAVFEHSRRMVAGEPT